ncbi:hypothetical protein EXIGLDRAFT_583010, partial [Exidia glandulosa HHB12029]
VLRRFGMESCTPAKTPLDPRIPLTHDMSPRTEAEREVMRNVPYINAVGALAYLATAT